MSDSEDVTKSGAMDVVDQYSTSEYTDLTTAVRSAMSLDAVQQLLADTDGTQKELLIIEGLIDDARDGVAWNQSQYKNRLDLPDAAQARVRELYNRLRRGDDDEDSDFIVADY